MLRSNSQSTYIIPEKLPASRDFQNKNPPARKTSVLGDYEPDRIVPTIKKRPGNCTESLDLNLLPSSDKVRRVVGKDGRVIKISLLDDYQVPHLGKTPGES